MIRFGIKYAQYVVISYNNLLSSCQRANRRRLRSQSAWICSLSFHCLVLCGCAACTAVDRSVLASSPQQTSHCSPRLISKWRQSSEGEKSFRSTQLLAAKSLLFESSPLFSIWWIFDWKHLEGETCWLDFINLAVSRAFASRTASRLQRKWNMCGCGVKPFLLGNESFVSHFIIHFISTAQ